MCYVNILCFLSAVTMAVASLQQHAKADSIPEVLPNVDVYCGPRCVQFILSWYGQDGDDLRSLVDEVQGTSDAIGSSMEDIEKALKTRGIHTRAMNVANKYHVRWSEPVLVHLKSDQENVSGHFVILVPSRSPADSLLVWMGLAGITTMSSEELMARRSDMIMLTSAAPIREPGVAIESAQPTYTLAGVSILTVIGVMAVFITIRSLRN